MSLKISEAVIMFSQGRFGTDKKAYQCFPRFYKTESPKFTHNLPESRYVLDPALFHMKCLELVSHQSLGCYPFVL